MHTRNEIVIAAPGSLCLELARDVERWPEILPHYREVRFLRRDGPGRGRVRMSAYRHFGPLPWPTWWASEMVTDEEAGEVRYRHVAGITRGMEVLWELRPMPDVPRWTGRPSGGVGTRPEAAAVGEDRPAGADRPPGEDREGPRTRVVILHEWDGPNWPLIGGFAARRIIGPHFVKVVAARTLAGIRREAEDRWRTSSPGETGPDDRGAA